MALQNNPGCDCCDEPADCCQVIDVKPLPTLTEVGGVATYNDTAWDAQYVSGVEGTDNTVPANTTVTINVPIGCTDYVVDIEVLDDASDALTGWGEGLRIKVGDCLQVESERPAQSGVQNPTLISQHVVDYVDRDSSGSLTQYGDNYITYRFSELFTRATMISQLSGTTSPSYRTNYSGGGSNEVFTSRLPHDAQGLTVQITIETKDDAVEIGLIRVTSGHRMCNEITDLSITPTELCNTVIPDYELYTVREPVSELELQSGSLGRSYVKSGTVGESQFIPPCIRHDCDYEYSVDFTFDHYTGLYAWVLHWDGGTLPAGRSTEVDTYLTKCTTHSWQHGDKLIDWTAYEWREAPLTPNFTIETSITIDGDCNIVVPSADDETTNASNFWANYLYPSNGVPGLGDATQETNNCLLDLIYCGDDALGETDPKVYRSYILGSTTAFRKTIDLIVTRSTVDNSFGTPTTRPQAGSTVIPIKTTDYQRSAFTDTGGDCNFDTTVYTGYHVTNREDCVAGKIPMYNPRDESTDYPAYKYSFIGGEELQGLDDGIPTRDKQLSALSLFLNDEGETFEAETGLVMRYTQANLASYRPDYDTCGCDCTADELYIDDMTTIFNTGGSGNCNYFHRIMQFSDGSETWYIWWTLNQVSPYDKINVYLRRRSDCKEVEFLNISDRTWPDTSGAVTKTGSNTDGDTISITFHA